MERLWPFFKPSGRLFQISYPLSCCKHRSRSVTKKFTGKRIGRNEDPQLRAGQAQFVDDVEIPGMLHAAFLRSDYAHARLLSIDVSKARQRPGVVAVFTAEDMGDDWQPGPPLVSPPPTAKDVIFNSRRQVPLVKDKVRHTGEAIAVVIAESRYIAEDAVDDILAELEPLEAVTDLERGLEAGSPLVHEDLESNLAAHLLQKKGDYETARQKADLVIKRRIVIGRGAANDYSSLDNQVSLLSGCFIVTFLLKKMGRQIRFQIIVHQGTARLQTSFQINHGLQRFEFNQNIVDSILRNVAALGAAYCNGLARMPNFVFDEGNLSGRMENNIFGSWRGRNQRGTRLPIVAHIFRGEGCNHSRSFWPHFSSV